MPFSVRFDRVLTEKQTDRAVGAVERMIGKGGFTATIDRRVVTYKRRGHTVLELRNVRTAKPKPYCGQHPGPCEATGIPKKTTRYLEWQDWIAFNRATNKALDGLPWASEAWSSPHDVDGLFWIRRGNVGRVHFHWYGEDRGSRERRVWNQGTPDQFRPEPCNDAEADGRCFVFAWATVGRSSTLTYAQPERRAAAPVAMTA